MEQPVAHTLLLSVHPRYAAAILRGSKTVELRRVRPRVAANNEVIFYESAPTCAVVARAVVRRLIEAPPNVLWREVATACCVDRVAFFEYFADRKQGYAIEFGELSILKKPVTLARLRRAVPTFTPPQLYQYLSDDCPRGRKLAACLS